MMQDFIAGALAIAVSFLAMYAVGRYMDKKMQTKVYDEAKKP